MNSSDKQIIKIHRKRLSCADNDSNFGNYKNIEEDWENLQNNSNLKNIRMQTEFDKTKVLPNIILPNLNYPENPWQKIQSDFTFEK